MKLQELFAPSLAERRRNPEMSIRETGHATALAYLQSQGDITNYGVSMTNIPKLGINPSSKYNTPIGIYFYPAKYYVQTKLDKDELEFQDTAPYIQLFKYSGAVLNIDTVDRDQFSQYISTLTSNLDSIAQLVDYKGADVSEWFYGIVAAATTQAAQHSLGGHLWYILYTLSRSSMKTMRGATPRSAIVWNKLFRMIGVDVVVDSSMGIIHPNEPVQGVVVNPNAISLLKTISNTSGSSERSFSYKKLEKMPVESWGDLQTIMDFIVDENLINYDVRYGKQTKAVLNKCWKFLTANPEIFVKLNEVQIGTLLLLTDDAGVKKQFRLSRARALFLAQFPKLKSDDEELLNQIKNLLPDHSGEKGQKFIKTVYGDQIKKLKNLVWVLGEYAPSDKDLANMHAYFKESLDIVEELISSIKT